MSRLLLVTTRSGLPSALTSGEATAERFDPTGVTREACRLNGGVAACARGTPRGTSNVPRVRSRLTMTRNGRRRNTDFCNGISLNNVFNSLELRLCHDATPRTDTPVVNRFERELFISISEDWSDWHAGTDRAPNSSYGTKARASNGREQPISLLPSSSRRTASVHGLLGADQSGRRGQSR